MWVLQSGSLLSEAFFVSTQSTQPANGVTSEMHENLNIQLYRPWWSPNIEQLSMTWDNCTQYSKATRSLLWGIDILHSVDEADGIWDEMQVFWAMRQWRRRRASELWVLYGATNNPDHVFISWYITPMITKCATSGTWLDIICEEHHRSKHFHPSLNRFRGFVVRTFRAENA